VIATSSINNLHVLKTICFNSTDCKLYIVVKPVSHISLKYNVNVFYCLFSFQSEIGFGKIESYTKLDKLGEVSECKTCLIYMETGENTVSFCIIVDY